MKKIFIKCMLLLVMAYAFYGCKEKLNYPGGEISPYFPIYDIRGLYKGADVTLNTDNMFGSNSIAGVVISDHSSNNLPSGLLIIQEKRRLNLLRGIAIAIGPDAANYVPGDSVHIKVDGATLKRVDGLLQITGVKSGDVTKVASGIVIKSNRGFANQINATPQDFDCTLITIVKATYNPTLNPTDVIAGDKVLNDGTDNIAMYTEANATFANNIPPYSGNYTGIMFNFQRNGTSVAQHRIRTVNDIRVLSATVDIPEFVITGFINDPEGTDANYEYIQFRAIQDINFATTPFSVVTNNNAGTATPIGLPVQGWATGDVRSYKLELTSGTVSKGDFFYVGGTGKGINASSSTSMASSKWIKSFNYSTTNSPAFYPGGPVGTKTSNLLANSGNAFGMAVFRGKEVRETSAPIDVVWVNTGGTLYKIGDPPTYGNGYRIGNTDVYDIIEPITGIPQPYYRAGTNTAAFKYVLNGSSAANAGYFYILGGAFDTTLNKWVKARSQTIVDLSKTSTIDEIENERSTEVK